MRKRPMIIGFICTKGGVGKSTLATYFANYLAYIKGRKIAIVDTDSLQNTIYENRKEDEVILKNRDDVEKEFMSQPYPSLYPVTKSPIEDLIGHIENEIISLENDYDYIIVDTKGDINQEAAMQITRFRFCFIPTELSDTSVKAASNTGLILDKLMELAHDSIELRQYRFIWSRFIKTPRSDIEMEQFLDSDFTINHLRDKFLTNKMTHRLALKQRSLYNTILFPNKSKLNDLAPELLPLLEEMYQEIENENKIYLSEDD